ncbi:MAG: polysaccharide deacetylase family protein [Bacteroidales bacterium]
MNILTFDIEDWWGYKSSGCEKESDYRPRLDKYLSQILDILSEKEIKATFFCLGVLAKDYPEVVKKIADRGHHIGCHSFSHDFFKDATRAEFEEDTKKGLQIIEDLIGRKVTAYRAPAFSITEQNKWAFEVLAENGILYDCSIFPTTRSYGGFPSYKTAHPAIIEYNGISIKEFPISLTKILKHDIAYSGGGYFRLFPYNKIKSIMNNSDYVMTYFHIKDFDKEQKKKFNLLEVKMLFLGILKAIMDYQDVIRNLIIY